MRLIQWLGTILISVAIVVIFLLGIQTPAGVAILNAGTSFANSTWNAVQNLGDWGNISRSRLVVSVIAGLATFGFLLLAPPLRDSRWWWAPLVLSGVVGALVYSNGGLPGAGA